MALTKVSSSLVSDNAITTGKLVDGGVHSADIATNAITSTKIAQNSILTKHIDDGQVTTAQLGADAVTAAKIADDAISEEHLDVTVITGLTEVTAATGDLLMVADISDSNNLKKIPVSSILAGTHTGAVNTSGSVTSATASFTRLEVNATNTKLKGDLFANTDAAFDIGASGANRPRNLYLSNSITAADITTTGVGAFGTISSGAITSTGAITAQSGGGLYLRPTNSSDTDAWILYQYTDDTFRMNFTGAGADEFTLSSAGNAAFTGTISSGAITSSGNLHAGDGTNISMDSSANGQLEVDGNGYQGAIALDGSAMHVYHNSSSRSLILGTNETARLTIAGTGGFNFHSNNLTSVGTISSGAITSSGPITVNNVNDTYNFKAIAGDTDSWFGVYDDANNSANVIVTRSDGATSFLHLGHTGATTINGTLSSGALSVNSGSTNVVASFVSSDGTAGIKLQDNAGNIELSATGSTFNVQPSGGASCFTVSTNVGATGAGGAFIPNGKRLAFDQQGVRSWTQYAAGGNLLFASGDGSGAIQANNFTGNTLALAGALTSTVASSGGVYHSITHTGNEAWTWAAQSGSGSDDYLDVGISGGTRAMSWHEDGKVGIGTTSPASKLHISGNSDVSDEDCQLIIEDVDGSAGSRIPSIQFRSFTSSTVTNQGRIRATDTQGMVLSGSSAQGDDLVVQAGKIGIGTNSPATAIHSHSTSGSPELRLTTGQNSGTPTAQIGYSAGSGYFLRLGDAANNEDIMLRTYGVSSFMGGNVGIGTTSPYSKLEVAGMAADAYTATSFNNVPAITIKHANTDTNYGGIRFSNTAGNYEHFFGAVQTSAATADIVFQGYDRAASAYKEYLRITDGGNVGIGTTSPDSKLHLKDTASNSIVQTTWENDARKWSFGVHGGLSDAINLYDHTASASRFTVLSSGNVGIGTTTPAHPLSVRAANAKITACSTADSQIIGFQARYLLDHATLYGSFEYHTGDAQLYIDNNFVGNNGVYSDINIRNKDTSGNFHNRLKIKGSTGRVGIGTTAPTEKLSVSGCTGIFNGHNDLASHTYATGSIVSSGKINGTVAYSGTYAANKKWTFTYAATTWKSWQATFRIASTCGFAVMEAGGYWNNGGPLNVIEDMDSNTVATLTVTTSGQNLIFTITLNTTHIHPFIEWEYRQGGGDGAPRMDRMSLVQS